MTILSDNDLFNIKGGSSIIACTYYGLIKVMRWISKLLRF